MSRITVIQKRLCRFDRSKASRKDAEDCWICGLGVLRKLRPTCPFRAILAENRQLREVLEGAIDGLIWCSGSADFLPKGKARRGWLKGPAIAIEEGLKIIKGGE